MFTMVNTEEFSKRLKLIIDHYGISAAILAERMQVQRSSISHILSGRNKPSLDFVMKILKSFPEVELYWLLNGEGEFPKTNTPTTPLHTPKKTATIAPTEIVKPNEPLPESISNSTSSDIERIVIFYKNGTFKNFIP